MNMYKDSFISSEECSVSVNSDGDEFSDEEPSSTKDETHNEESLASIQERLSKKESESVFRLRLLVVLVLLLAAGSVCFVVYRLTENGENDLFQSQYEGAAEKILECKQSEQKLSAGLIGASC